MNIEEEVNIELFVVDVAVVPVGRLERGIVVERVGDVDFSFPNTKLDAIFDIPGPLSVFAPDPF